MKIKYLIFSGIVFGLPLLATAADFHFGGDYSLSTSEKVFENLYLVSDTATIDGTVRGGVSALGQVVDFSGTADRANIIGGEVYLGGTIKGDVHASGALMTVTGRVGGDLVVLGGELLIAPDAVIDGDLIALSASTTISGTIKGVTRVAAKNLVLGGTFLKAVRAFGSHLSLSSGAVLKNGLRYYSESVLVRADGARVDGLIEWKGKDAFLPHPSFGFILGIGAFLGLLMTLVLAYFFLFMFREFSEDVVSETFSGFRWHLWRGALIVIGAPAIAALLCVTIVGIPLGILLALFYAAGLITAGVFTGVALGSYITKRLFKRAEYEVTWKIILGGTVLLFLLKAIPFVGIILSIFLMLPILSAMTRLFYEQMKGE